MEENIIPLNKAKEGETVIVRALTVDDRMRRRLLDIGLVEKTAVTCLQKSPLGDPTAYLIRGAVIALRAEDADGITVCRAREA